MIPKPQKRKKLKRSHKALKREANQLLHKIVCKSGRCAWCGSTERLQTSHVLPKGTYRGWLAYEPLNCIPLCYRCHLHRWHKNPLEATEWFRLCFPQRYVWLQEHKSIVAKADLDKVILELKEMLK